MSKTNASSAGHTLWSKMPKANAELFALTYGSLVTELIRDYSSVSEVNAQLDRLGHSIGVRLVDEFLSKADLLNVNVPACTNLRDTAEVLAKIGFRMFLGVTCDVANFSADGNSFSLYLYENPLAIFVELPPEEERDERILYSNVYCGVIRGALEQVNLRVECRFVRDVLHGEEVNEIRVELKEVLMDGAGDDYKEE
eukprot:CAMPEP_0172488412 /NCGR_PEP_ID=MMETSP1066-20121228/17921_1 /TAXON_ID=671091 /ORGANISM="Coscinodiscus wailesii, Strain CCMP2513" /LENGTH=196 /DNA_ID=CAMNT_0013255609 /DNA_START=136 /DNA_END=726 /DNA_ORIENTATION=-